MKKISEKWYMSIFIIPIILTYLTNFIELPDILKNWEFTIIISLAILTMILFYENWTLKNFLNKIPKEHDKKIIINLINTLDLDSFEEDISSQNAWYGYKKEAIQKILEFTNDSRHIKNQLIDKQLDNHLQALVTELEKFTEYGCKILFNDHLNYYSLLKENNELQIKSKINAEHLNNLSSNCLRELRILILYLKKRGYM